MTKLKSSFNFYPSAINIIYFIKSFKIYFGADIDVATPSFIRTISSPPGKYEFSISHIEHSATSGSHVRTLPQTKHTIKIIFRKVVFLLSASHIKVPEIK